MAEKPLGVADQVVKGVESIVVIYFEDLPASITRIPNGSRNMIKSGSITYEIIQLNNTTFTNLMYRNLLTSFMRSPR